MSRRTARDPHSATLRGGACIVLPSLAYLVIAAAVAFYLLPVGLQLSGVPLVSAQFLVVLLGAGALAWTWVAVRRDSRRRESLIALCISLGWTFRPDVSDWVWGGSIDEQIERGSRTATDHLDAREGALPFDSVEHSFVVGDGEGSTLHSARSVRIPLPAEAPRISLRSRSGRGVLSALPRRAAASAELRLEGDFSDVFEVSAPSGYETDALYVLTPDLMVILLDAVPDLDLEIVDRTLYAYFPALDLTDARELARFVSVVAALYERFGRRTMLYRDEAAQPLEWGAHRRVGDTLSDRARTLRTRMRLWPVITAVLTPLIPLAIALIWTASNSLE